MANINRTVAAFELWLIVVPMFFLSFGGLALVAQGAPDITLAYQRVAYMGLLLSAPLLCICCGALTGILASHGPDALVGAPRVYWAGTFIGTALVLFGLAAASATRTWSFHPTAGYLDTKFGIFSIGVPMLIPAIHVTLARQRWR
jgi:hypothetical protein